MSLVILSSAVAMLEFSQITHDSQRRCFMGVKAHLRLSVALLHGSEAINRRRDAGRR